MAHGKDADTDKSARIAGAAQFASRRLDADRTRLYVDLILHSLSEAARRELQTMEPFKQSAMTGRLLATIAILALVACHSNEPQPAAQTGSDEVTYELTGTRWALLQLGDKKVTVSDEGREAYIVLNSVELTVVGFAGCNRISTNYKSNGAQLSFGNVNATRMVCTDMPTETALLQAMKATAGWRISGSQLELLDARQTTLARFEARNL